jgi:hypothetical protein
MKTKLIPLLVVLSSLPAAAAAERTWDGGAVTASWNVPKNGPQRIFRVIALKPRAGE